MTLIKVLPETENSEGWIFKVEVIESKGKTSHKVTLVKYDYNNLTGGKIPADELVRKSFEFLLTKEPKEKILEEFNLMEISQYFSDYTNFVSKLSV